MAETSTQQTTQQTTQQSTQTTQPWYQGVAGVDETVVGHWKNQGWDTKTPAEVAVSATKAWKEAEKFVGAPAAQLLRVPKDAADEAGWNAVWTRLGKPADPKEYDFSTVKYSDGTAPEDTFIEAMRSAAHRLHLPKDAAPALTREVVKYLESADTTEAAERTAKLVEQKAALKKNWGPNEAANLFIAQRAAAALGVPPETVSALEGVIGYDRVMEMFRLIGSKIGEDKFVTSTGRPAGGVMTREEAIAKKQDLMTNIEWRKSYLAGDKAKFREMQALEIIISGVNQQAA